MSPVILHHYEMSPFSAKIRAMLGYCQLPWYSALTSPMPPRPLLDALAGGYRRIPVVQVGADIFCDSRLISDEIAQWAERPALAYSAMDETQRALVDHAELETFFACVSKAAGWELTWRVLKMHGPITLLKTLRDRLGMARSMRAPRLQPGQVSEVVAEYLDDLEGRLEADFLFGSAPGIADFSAWHGLWFACRMGGRDLLSGHPRVQAWAGRIDAYDDGSREPLTPEACLTQAREAAPRRLPDDPGEDALLGKHVSIAPADYARDEVAGILVASLPDRLVLRRETSRAGVVHVHFPRARFEVARL